MSKTFVTIFYPATNIHLVKDVGMIPYYMHKLYGYDSTLVCYKNTEQIYSEIGQQDYISVLDDSYNNLDTVVKGLKMEFIDYEGKFFSFQKSVLKYLFKNSKNIDVLNLYHFTPESFLFGFIYKLRNPKGKIFLKMDASLPDFESLRNTNYISNPFKNSFLKLLRYFFIKKVDILSNETQDSVKSIDIIDKNLVKKCIYLPNGIDDLFLKENKIKQLDYEEKENIIVAVGRLGTFQKNTELLLESLVNVDLQDWKVFLIGHIEGDFHKYLGEFFTNYPLLKNKIIFKGNINDRKELFGIYNRSKIFISTSRYESFGISMIEALSFGNYILSTKTGIIGDICNNDENGRILIEETPAFISNEINRVLKDSKVINKRFDSRLNFSESFMWSNIIGVLNNKIKMKINE